MTDAGFHRLARVAGAMAILLGFAGLLGWILDIALLKSVLPGLVTMKMNTAVSFVLAGTSLLLQVEPTSPPRRRLVGRVCAALVTALGTLTVFEYVLGVDFGIDQLLVRAPAGELQTSSPGRMAPNTALSLAFVGLALLLLDAKRRALRSMTQVLAITVLLIGFVGTTGYVLSVTALFGVAGYTSMAIHTAAGITLLSTGLLASRPQRGVVAILAQNNHSGAALRRFLPVVLLAPLALGWLRMEGQRAGFYGTEFGLALMVTASTSVLASVVIWNARIQGAAEAAQQEALRDARFLFELSELLRTSSKASDVLFDVSKRLGEYVGASRCVFIEVDVAGDQATVHRDYCKGLPSLAGTLRLSSFSPESLAAATAGRILVSSDTSLDALTSKQYEKAYGPAGIRARVVVPLLRGGQYVSTLLVSTHEPREWQQREVALIETVAERTWVWFEHLGTVEALHDREREREALLAQLQDLNASLEQRVQTRTADLAATLKEREVLLQEIHHRVKNNLYVIVSLMEMQARTMKHSEGRRALEECQGRVHAIALIHEKLYQSENYAEIPFADYLRGLADDVFHATGVSHSTVDLTLSVADVPITVEKAIPCGLILNELITNALKHAFPGGRSGTIRVELGKADAGRLRLAVADNGVGLPPGLNIHEANSLGLRLVGTLAGQLDGELKVNGARGTSFELEFPVES